MMVFTVMSKTRVEGPIGASECLSAEKRCCMCERSTNGTPSAPCGDAANAAPSTRSHNYDTLTGQRVNPVGGYYMIPADQYGAVLARMRVDPRILNCYRFVPLRPATPCPPAPAGPRRGAPSPPPKRARSR